MLRQERAGIPGRVTGGGPEERDPPSIAGKVTYVHTGQYDSPGSAR